MILMVKNLVEKTPGKDLQFFQDAYYHCFNKQGNIIPDLYAYRESGKLPLYVTSYVRYLESLNACKL